LLQTENHRLRQDQNELEAKKADCQYFANRYTHIVNNLILPYAHRKDLHFDGRTAKTLDFVIRPLLQDAKQVDVLRKQVHDLQQELMVNAKKTNAIPDEQFAQDFRSLAAQIKTLSRQLRPFEGADVVSLLRIGGLASGSARHHWTTRAGTKRFLEAWTWSALISTVLRFPFTIFGKEGQGANNLWMSLFHTNQHSGWPCPSLSSENWRQATMEQLVSLVDQDIVTKGKEKANYLWLEDHLVKARAELADYIASGLSVITPTVDRAHVRQIIDKSFTLAMQMALQRPRLQVTYPRVGAEFNSGQMSFDGEEEEEGPEDGIVAVVVNPGLTKWGDAHGEKYDHRYDIVRALVQFEKPAEGMYGVSLI
jgi:hypothetical protein